MNLTMKTLTTANAALALAGDLPARLLLASGWLLVRHTGKKGDVYNILWAMVFGFATLNILSLVARKFEPGRRGMSFGELLAVSVVLLSMCLLGWELLNVFHVFPIKLGPR